jgi:glycosyltransferase involved in cell wall biosynthesis
MSLSIDNSRRNFNLKRKYIASNNNITFVTVSDWLKDLLLKSMYKKLNIHCIYNGIDIDVFKPKVNGLKEKLGLKEKFVILVTGTVWLPYKGINDYAKLRDLLSDEYAIVFVGVSERYLLTIPKNIICIKKTKGLTQTEVAKKWDIQMAPMRILRAEVLECVLIHY